MEHCTIIIYGISKLKLKLKLCTYQSFAPPTPFRNVKKQEKIFDSSKVIISLIVEQFFWSNPLLSLPFTTQESGLRALRTKVSLENKNVKMLNTYCSKIHTSNLKIIPYNKDTNLHAGTNISE